ncbi:methyltransferase domain-containing protein [Arthrobacter sp.]|uniref:class I SAM-dependent methyltransferase n=1 Tax=Arthrobacter sp. TaxID=1667 RepID=UPI00281167FE|nr:methyltransferase domain-containing protein [Arthrobacter sp.]
MGSATTQGQLWGARAQDFATYVEQLTLPLASAVLDAAHVTPSTRLLDAGCGAGLLAVLASFRGARVTALDASPQLVAIAQERLPKADIREGDLEALPFADAGFDAVTAVNSIFYAADMSAAMRELVRVVRSGGRVVVTAWGPPERCELLTALVSRIGPLMPTPPPGVSPPHPATLAEPGALAEVLQQAGLRIVDEGEVACPFVFPSTELSWRANASAGPNQMAIAHSGEAAVRAAFMEADREHTRPDGSVRYENVFLWVAGEKQS